MDSESVQRGSEGDLIPPILGVWGFAAESTFHILIAKKKECAPVCCSEGGEYADLPQRGHQKATASRSTLILKLCQHPAAQMYRIREIPPAAVAS